MLSFAHACDRCTSHAAADAEGQTAGAGLEVAMIAPASFDQGLLLCLGVLRSSAVEMLIQIASGQKCWMECVKHYVDS